jgi:hypothetical protein
MTPTFEIAVTLKGSNLQDVLAQAQALIDAEGKTAPTATAGKRTRKAAPVAEPEADSEELLAMDEETDAAEESEELGFDEETEVEEPPKKSKKLTDKDVNAAAMAHAKKHGRPKTLALLEKKFKVKSILELKADQYPAVVAALKV